MNIFSKANETRIRKAVLSLQGNPDFEVLLEFLQGQRDQLHRRLVVVQGEQAVGQIQGATMAVEDLLAVCDGRPAGHRP